jgi:hypothetical protein
MQLETLAVRLRPRTQLEAADLGVRLGQTAARSIYPCCVLAAAPLMLVAAASYGAAAWLPAFVIWWTKPWLDRTILFVLSRAAFGVATVPADVWRARREVWWRQIPFTLTVRRLSPWRAFTEPVYQLEHFAIRNARDRIRRIRSRGAASAVMVTSMFALCETALLIAVLSLAFWLAPSGRAPQFEAFLGGGATTPIRVALPLAYAATVVFLEPFYVAAGFGMYLNRRAELEAWDIEQEFRRAFGR